MLAEIVFVTRFLSLVTGLQPVSLEGDAAIRSVELRSDNVKIAALKSPPWSAQIDFGSEITPRELTAIAFDEQGREIGRDTQIVNLPRPVAEIALLLKRTGETLTAHVEATNVMGQRAVEFVATVDGKVIQKSTSIVPEFQLPALDSHTIHSLGVEIRFPDQTRARKEMVFGGIYSEQVPAELTPVAVRAREKATDARPACLTLDGETLVPSAIENERGRAYFVIVGTGGLGRQRLKVGRLPDLPFQIPRADLVAVAPSSHTVETSSELKTSVFEMGNVPDVLGARRLVLRIRKLPGVLQIRNAIAAAGLHALGTGRRRAIVLVIGGEIPSDHSTHSAQAVRRYLQRIGVPLHVWSLDGRRPDLEADWGAVQDVSNVNEFLRATDVLKKDLASQRIAWMPVTPMNALRVRATVDCTFTPLAKGE